MPTKLLELVDEKAIVPLLQADDRAGVVRELVYALVRAGQLGESGAEAVARSILARERSGGTTGIGKGIALPHAKVDELTTVVGALGRSPDGVDFAALDGEPVYAIFLILSPTGEAERHLAAMDVVYRLVQQERFRRFLRQADSSEKIRDLLAEADEALFSDS